MDNVLSYMVSLCGSDRPAMLEDLTSLHTWWWGNARLQRRCSGRPRRTTLIFLRVPTRMIMLMHARAHAGYAIFSCVRIFAKGTRIESAASAVRIMGLTILLLLSNTIYELIRSYLVDTCNCYPRFLNWKIRFHNQIYNLFHFGLFISHKKK